MIAIGRIRCPVDFCNAIRVMRFVTGSDRLSRRRRGACPRLLPAIALVVALGVSLGAACRSANVLPPAEVPSAEGTLAGTVRGPQGVAPPPGREVEAVEVDSGARYATETNVSGGFSLMVPPGRYRIEVSLVSGEQIVRDPGIVTVEAGGLADGQNVVLGGAGIVGQE